MKAQQHNRQKNDSVHVCVYLGADDSLDVPQGRIRWRRRAVRSQACSVVAMVTSLCITGRHMREVAFEETKKAEIKTAGFIQYIKNNDPEVIAVME